MKVWKIFLVTLISISFINAVTISADPKPITETAKGQPYPPPFLDGNWIFLGPDNMELPVDEPCFVIHGFGLQHWKESPPEWRQTLLHDSVFSLKLDDEPVRLRKWVRYYRYFDFLETEDFMLIVFYVQFEANEFQAGGEYSFKGVWEEQGVVLLELEMTVGFN